MTFANEYLSYSRLERYAQCPKSYELHYVRKLPARPNPATQFGSVLHAALEATYRAIAAEPLVGAFPEGPLLAAFEAAWNAAGLSDFALFGDPSAGGVPDCRGVGAGAGRLGQAACGRAGPTPRDWRVPRNSLWLLLIWKKHGRSLRGVMDRVPGRSAGVKAARFHRRKGAEP